MTSKKTAEKNAAVQKGKETERRRVLSVFPTDIGKLNKEECAELLFKPNGMAETIIQALQKHGVNAGEKRRQVVAQVREKFADASDSTIRTQVYRGIVYLRATSKSTGE